MKKERGGKEVFGGEEKGKGKGKEEKKRGMNKMEVFYALTK